MSSDKVAARKGRLRQRYDNDHRLVAGCVPYRVKKDDEGNPCSSPGAAADPAQVEVLMISTPNRTDMVFPKGGWEDDEDVYEAACREVMEEAGVKGIIDFLSSYFCRRAVHWGTGCSRARAARTAAAPGPAVRASSSRWR